MSLAADGNTAIVGGTDDNGGTGAAWVFVRAVGIWRQQGPKLVGTAATLESVQGSSVAISADGSTVVVGGSNDGGGVGAAWIFTRSGTSWTQQGAKLIGTGIAGTTTQGWSAALSADGNTAIVGGVNGAGAAWIFSRTGGIWTQQGGPLVGSDAVGISQQGDSVALSADGNTAIVGGWNDTTNGVAGIGAAWVYIRSGGVWKQQGPKLIGTGAVGIGCQGISVRLSADGNTALVGGDCDNTVGVAWVFTRSGSTWTQQGAKLIGTGAVTDGFFGDCVALSADGTTAIIGAPGEPGSQGAVWTFVQATGPTIAYAGVVNGATFRPGIAPGTWITILGAKLSATARSWTTADFLGNDLPTQLDNVSVNVNGKPAYVSYISPGQINALAPDDAPQDSPVAVQTAFAQMNSNVVMVHEASLAPALFTFSQQENKYVAAVSVTGNYIGPASLIPGITTVPTKPGDTIILFGTGFGSSTPANAIGQLVDPAPLAGMAVLTIGGIVADTKFAGIVGPGLYQFNVIVPNAPNGDNQVVIEIGGSPSQPNVFLNVQQ